jgi:hypothetical protein
MKILIIFLMLLVLGSLLIISNNNLAFYKSGNPEKFGVLWIKWIEKIFENIGLLTGNVVKLNWGPE